MKWIFFFILFLLVPQSGGAIDVGSTAQTFQSYDRSWYSNQTIEKVLWQDDTGILNRKDDTVTIEVTVTSEYPVEFHLIVMSQKYYFRNDSDSISTFQSFSVDTSLAHSGSKLTLTIDWSDLVVPEGCIYCDSDFIEVKQDEIKMWLESKELWNQTAEVEANITTSESSPLLNDIVRFHIDYSEMNFVNQKGTKEYSLDYNNIGLYVALLMLVRRRKK